MIKLLLVEDDTLLRDLASRRLEREGYRVVTALNGAEAIIRTRNERPDLILMDMGLPLLDGFQATARIKGEPGICSIPIIALTAFSTNDRASCLAAGCDEYETKPIAFERLLNKITALLKPARGITGNQGSRLGRS
jgi:two-component system, cell cycle response regulator DivK